jgi:hypothetical protein
MTEQELAEQVKKAKAEYNREWRRKNPEKVKQNLERYWRRKALKKDGEGIAGNDGQ